MKTDARLLRRAHRDIRDAMVQLVDPIPEPIDTAVGPRTHVGPSLMTQLRIEISNSGNHGVSRSRNAPIPINPDAYDLFVQILRWSNATVDNVDSRLRTMVADAAYWTDLDALRDMTAGITGWVSAIRALLNPLRRYHIAKPCPRCQNTMAWRLMPNGERTQTHALVVDGVNGCECLVCGARWPTTHLEHLARVLGCDPLPGAVISATILA